MSDAPPASAFLGFFPFLSPRRATAPPWLPVSPSPPHATALLLPPGSFSTRGRAPPPPPSLTPTRGPPASFSTRGRPPPPRPPASSFSTRGDGRQIQGRRTRRRGLPPSPSPAPARLLPPCATARPRLRDRPRLRLYNRPRLLPTGSRASGRVPSRAAVRSTDGGADGGVDRGSRTAV
jgi:hypothetical protein